MCLCLKQNHPPSKWLRWLSFGIKTTPKGIPPRQMPPIFGPPLWLTVVFQKGGLLGRNSIGKRCGHSKKIMCLFFRLSPCPGTLAVLLRGRQHLCQAQAVALAGMADRRRAGCVRRGARSVGVAHRSDGAKWRPLRHRHHLNVRAMHVCARLDLYHWLHLPHRHLLHGHRHLVHHAHLWHLEFLPNDWIPPVKGAFSRVRSFLPQFIGEQAIID